MNSHLTRDWRLWLLLYVQMGCSNYLLSITTNVIWSAISYLNTWQKKGLQHVVVLRPRVSFMNTHCINIQTVMVVVLQIDGVFSISLAHQCTRYLYYISIVCIVKKLQWKLIFWKALWHGGPLFQQKCEIQWGVCIFWKWFGWNRFFWCVVLMKTSFQRNQFCHLVCAFHSISPKFEISSWQFDAHCHWYAFMLNFWLLLNLTF